MKTIMLIAAALLAAPTALAGDCTSPSPTHEVELLGIYVDNDACQPDCIASVWVYQETNGMSGLQRGDDVHDDTCGGKFTADTVLLRVSL